MNRELPSAEKEQLVVDNRSSHRSAELIPFERIANGREEVACIEDAIAHELKEVPVKVVGAGLGHDVNRAGTVLPVLRRQRAGLDLELLQRVWERKRQTQIIDRVVVRPAVHHVSQGTVGAAASYGDGSLVGIVLARVKLADVAERNRRGGSGEVNELSGLAAIERELNHALRIDQLSDPRAARLHETCVRLHFDLFADLADL